MGAYRAEIAHGYAVPQWRDSAFNTGVIYRARRRGTGLFFGLLDVPDTVSGLHIRFARLLRGPRQLRLSKLRRRNGVRTVGWRKRPRHPAGRPSTAPA